jgi:hypothetical protein
MVLLDHLKLFFSTTGITATPTVTPTDEPSSNNDDFENAIEIGLNESSYSNGIIGKLHNSSR